MKKTFVFSTLYFGPSILSHFLYEINSIVISEIKASISSELIHIILSHVNVLENKDVEKYIKKILINFHQRIRLKNNNKNKNITPIIPIINPAIAIPLPP